MIKVEMNEGVVETLELSGTVFEIGADVLVLIRAIYERIEETNPKRAQVFKKAIENSSSIAFKDLKEIAEENTERLEEIKEAKKQKDENEKLQKIIDKLEEVNKMVEDIL